MVGEEKIPAARLLYESRATHEHERAAEQLAEEVILLDVASGDLYRGRMGFLNYVRGWTSALPDLRIRTLEIASLGDRAVAEYEISGSHTGPLVTPRGHIPPTGSDVQIRFCDVLEFRDGKCVHLRSYFDSATLLRQMGLITATPLHTHDRRASLDMFVQSVDQHAPQRNMAIVRRFLQNVFNRQDPAAAADSCHLEFAWHGGSLGESRGLGRFQEVLSALFFAFPDLQVEVLDAIAEGDRVVVRYALSGTHRGVFQGIAPTGRRVMGGGTSIFHMEDSRIVEEWWQADLLALLRQMDAAPSTPRLP